MNFALHSVFTFIALDVIGLRIYIQSLKYVTKQMSSAQNVIIDSLLIYANLKQYSDTKNRIIKK